MDADWYSSKHIQTEKLVYSFVCLLFGFDCLKTVTLYKALAFLEITMKTRLAYNSERPTCLCLLSGGSKDMHHRLAKY